MTSPAVLVIMLNNFTFHYAFFILMSWMPTFYEQKLGLDAGSYTWLKMIPYLVMGTCSNVGGIVADKMMSSKAYSPTYVRKLLNTIGFVLAALALWSLPLCTSVGSAAFVSSVALGALAVARGLYERVPRRHDCSVLGVAKRIMENRAEFEARNARKTKSESAYYAEKKHVAES